jgi:hypothetical protein
MLPDVFYLLVGLGGKGGAGQVQGGSAAVAGGSGVASSVVYRQYGGSVAGNTILIASFPGGGQIAQTGGTPGAAISFSSSRLYSIGLTNSIAGATGGAGSTTTTGNSVTMNTTNCITCPGAGGAGVNAGTTTAAGGNVTSAGVQGLNTIPGGLAGGGNGGNGYNFIAPGSLSDGWMLASGGSGGGSNTSAGTGGNGGNGGTGSGGGGGGGTNGTSSIAGAGGSGGTGFIFIQCW